MKFSKIYMLAGALMLALMTACQLEEIKPQDAPDEEYATSPDGIPKLLPGTYAKFAENDWEKMYYQMTEFMGDNVSLSGRTSDPLFFSYVYGQLPEQANGSTLWSQAYNIIAGTNLIIALIEGSEEELTDDVRHTYGEAKFIRAYTHFAITGIWGKPYSHGRDNLGVVIKEDTVSESLPRATVGEVYDFVEAELREATQLMSSARQNTRASKEVAQALLSRLYLYKDDYANTILYADSVINAGRYQLASDKYSRYFTYYPTENEETIFCVAHNEDNNAWWWGLGSMYSNYNGVGWGEMYASQSYRELVGENENDARHSFIDVQYAEDGAEGTVTDPISGETVFARNNYPKVYVNKFSLQEGVDQLSSPVVLRLAEMYLNKAEANAKLGNTQLALDDVNVIRQRAGLSGDQLYRTDNMLGRATVLDAVLDERRLELAWEGHRAMDVYRNMRNMDRSYPGTHLPEGETTQIISYTDDRILHYIPQREIELNPLLEQND